MRISMFVVFRKFEYLCLVKGPVLGTSLSFKVIGVPLASSMKFYTSPIKEFFLITKVEQEQGKGK